MVNIKSKKDSLTGYDTYIFHNTDTNQVMKWEMQNNGDLVWKYIAPNKKSDTYSIFNVNKKDQELYEIIDRIYGEIKNGQIYINDTDINIDFRHANKNSVAKFAASEMYDPLNDMVKWYSDESINSVKAVFINRSEDVYQLIFVSNDNEKSVDILFKQNGSFYECGAIPFIRAHNRLGKIIGTKEEKMEPKIYQFKKSA